ncbi:hypothetical protein F4678DRAFT_479088 [Xylaria arbuscula]|nr:hypothetical protein F4678DRAFT_479088 [Xylaria arbuscula]
MLIKFGIIFIVVSYLAVIAVCTYYNVPQVGGSGLGDVGFLARTTSAYHKVSIALSALGTFTDLYVITIPLASVSRLNSSTARRIGLAALFATGFLACGFSIASLVFRILLLRDPDPFWTVTRAYALAVAEINLGVICACVPVTFALFKLCGYLETERHPVVQKEGDGNS